MAPSAFEHILVLVDGSESSLHAAEFAIHLARELPARLTAISVVDTETLRKLMSARILVEQEVREFETELEKSQTRHLDFVHQLARKAGVQAHAVLGKGVCHSAVLAEQKSRKADLIVLGGFRSSLTKMDLNARERQLIVDEAPCPVLIVK